MKETALTSTSTNSWTTPSMKNVRGGQNIKLVHTKENEEDCCKPQFTTFTIFNQDLVATHVSKSTILLNILIFFISLFLICQSYWFTTSVWITLRTRMEVIDIELFYGYRLSHVQHQVWKHSPGYVKRQLYAGLPWIPAQSCLFNVCNKEVLGKMKDETASVPN